MIETQPQSPESSHPLVTKESTTISFSSFMVPKVTYVVLILLLTLTVSAAAFMFLQNQSLKYQIGSSTTCDYNGQTYQVGEGFSASDACNSCSCSESGEVTCTEMACNISNPPESPNTEPVALVPDQSGKFTLNSTRLGFSTSFNAPDMLVTNCQGSGEGYEFWIYSSDADARAGVCSYEGPVGILLTRVEDTSQIECWPNDETYSLERQEKVINQNNLIYCRSSLKNINTSSEDYPLNPLITSAYIINPADNSAIWVWMQDSELQPVFDQILSTFEFTDPDQSDNNDNEVSDLPTEIIKYSPKSDWQTYKDTVAGYEIQFAQTSKVHEYPGATVMGESLSITACPFKDPQGKEVCLTDFSIRIFNNFTGGSRRAWLQENLNTYKPYYMDWIIDGKNALVAIDGNPGGSSSQNILIPHGKQMIVFMVSGVAWDRDTGKVPDLSYVKSVLSTFKTIE